MGRVKDKVFTVNLHHDGIFITNPIKYVHGELKQITDINFEEHYDYDVLEFLTIEGNVNETLYESSDEYYSSDEVEEIDYVDFHTKGEENVVIKNLSTQDLFLNKLCSNHGSFSGFIAKPQPVDQEPIDDPDAASIDPMFKVKKGVSYPKHDPTIPWNEMQLVLSIRYEHPEQLKLALANYGVANGYQLWYIRNDWRCMLVYCGKNVEAGSTPKKSVTGKKAKLKKKQGTPFKKGKPVKKAIHVKKSVYFSHNITKRSLNSGEGCSKHGEGTSRDAEKSPQSPKWTKRTKDGWFEGCKRVIGLDGCFLKHTCRGELLTAIGRDANNQMYSISWAVVRVENSDNWCWFLALLHGDLKLQQGTGLTLISDGHKSLHEAVRDWLPNSKHGKCTKHIYANFKKKFRGIQLQKLFWHAASCIVPQLFYSKMEEMKKINSEAYDYLIGRDPNSWSSAFFNLSVKCLAFKNGICESYHRAILLQRHKPIITMLEDIRVYLMQTVVAMHNIAINLEDQITPTVIKKLECLKRGQRHWTVFPSDYKQLEVKCGDSAFRVNLGEKTCACRLWQLSGTQMWKMTGNHPPLPPIVRRMPGRPRKERIKAPSENNSHVSRVGRVMRYRIRESVFGTHASARGRGRGSRGGRGARGGRNGSGRGARGRRNRSANRCQHLMDEDEIRENLEHDYMQDLLDAEEDKRVQKERECQEKLDEEVLQEAMEQQHINEQMDEERERQNREEREWEEMNDHFNPSNWTEDESMDVDTYNRKNSSINFNAFTQESVINDPSHPTQSTEVQVCDSQVTASAQENIKGKDIYEGDIDVAASALDKNKCKAIQEGSNSKYVAKPVRKSKRLR
ncbi:pentatricopeptide repeat-containing protein [Tanacetum coccineum]